MNSRDFISRDEKADRLKSGLLTALISGLALLSVFLYKVVVKIPPKKEVITRMLINFGDNQNGNQAQEPTNQEGSLAAKTSPQPAASTVMQSEPAAAVPTPDKSKKAEPDAKKLTRYDAESKVKISEKPNKKADENTSKKQNSAARPTVAAGSKSTVENAKTGSGDGYGKAAIGNLLKGRGTKSGSQGTAGTAGNSGDPAGGGGAGESKIGVDRNLTAYIPGTMGRGGVQPSHSCTASGNIIISYAVDKAGNVTSARRSSGISDPCIVSTSISWVRKYVKAERANTSSTGTYKITF